jgi:hypothetical protein
VTNGFAIRPASALTAAADRRSPAGAWPVLAMSCDAPKTVS